MRQRHHERPIAGETDVWLTPPSLLAALGKFDLDPCAPAARPWDIACLHYTIHDDGLTLPWRGRVWLNPPYGKQTGRWLARLAEHGNGIALIYARTETQWFFDHVWHAADALLFLRGRVRFCTPTGEARRNGTAPSVLVAYGRRNVWDLKQSRLDGNLIETSYKNRR